MFGPYDIQYEILSNSIIKYPLVNNQLKKMLC